MACGGSGLEAPNRERGNPLEAPLDLPDPEAVIAKIASLEIQGAANIACEGVKAFAAWTLSHPDSSEAPSFIQRLLSARPNEPMLANLLARFQSALQRSGSGSLRGELMTLLQELKNENRRMAEVGSRLVSDGMRVITHCHSSTVVNLLRRAWEVGKRFEVVCSETRPRWQGRITAKELAIIGIPVTQVVDNALWQHLRGAGLVLIGADVVLATQEIINKVGSYPLVYLADRFGVPVYCVTHTLKADSQSRLGLEASIEERNPAEVWPQAPPGVKIHNPAFDRFPGRFLTGFVTEKGLTRDLFSWMNPG